MFLTVVTALYVTKIITVNI